MSIKATVRKYWEISLSECAQIKAWLKVSPYRNCENANSYAAPSLCVGTVTEDGNTISHSLLESVILVSAVSVNPSADKTTALHAAAKLDSVIGELGRQWGVSSYLVIQDADEPLPEGEEDLHEIRNVRLFRRTISLAGAKGMLGTQNASTNVKYLN